MIKRYTIHNFKNHADSILELSNLNILTGINGMGKSSVMQSMLILRESFSKSQDLKNLILEGDSFSVGRTAELVNCNIKNEQDILKLTIQTDSDKLDFRYKYPLENANELEADEKMERLNTEALKKISLFNDDFQYLSAFRTGPQVSYNSNTSVVDRHHQISLKMGMGEYTAYYLNRYGNKDIPVEKMKYEGSESLTLYNQTEKWMGEISNGIRLKIDQNDTKIKLNFGYEQAGKTTVYHNAINTGYGISYILSVIVAILSAKPGALILIENPEAHIHPSGQASLMHLITLAAENGIQIILETHSDHIINGALVNFKKRDINKELLSIYYFDHDENLNANPQKVEIGDNRRIKNAPEGFFDQMSMDLEILFDL